MEYFPDPEDDCWVEDVDDIEHECEVVPATTSFDDVVEKEIEFKYWFASIEVYILELLHE